MTDPAIEAAKRAWIEAVHNDATFDVNDFECLELVTAAREMAKPIRELHEELTAEIPKADTEFMAGYVDAMRYVLNNLAPLIYTTEELNKEEENAR